MARRVRWLLVVFGVAALGGLGVSLGFRWLHSSTGEAALKEQLLGVVHGAIQGKLTVGRVVLEGTHVHLEGLELRTSEGEIVASLGVLDATVSLTQLARKRVVLDGVTLEGLAVRLDFDERGRALGRALAERTPSTASTSPSSWAIVVTSLALVRGSLALQAGATALSAVEVEAHGSASIDLGTLGVGGALTMAGRAEGAVEGPISLAVTADTATGGTRAHVALTVPRSSLKGTLDVGAREVLVEELVADPQTVAGFVPSWPLRVPVYAAGTLHLGHAIVNLHAGAAVVEASGAFGLSQPALSELTLVGHDLDLEELVGAPRPTRLGLEATGRLSDGRPATLSGALTLALTSSSASGSGTLKAQAVAEGGRVDLHELSASLPGLSMEVKGHGSTRALALEGRASSTDLALFRATMLELFGLPLPPLTGGAALELSVTGPPLRPAVKAHGQLTHVTIGPASAREAVVALELPDVRSPLDATLDFHASRVVVAERALDEVSLNLVTHGRALEARLKTRGLGELEILGAGELDVGETGGTLSALSLTATEVAWTLDGASHLSWGPGRFELSPLTLRDGAQRLKVSGRLSGKRVTASVEAERVELSRLPRALVPAELGLIGVTSLAASVDGALPWPDGVLTAKWSHGVLGSVKEIDASADVTLKGERLIGSASGSSSLGKAAVTVDVPVAARDEPVSAHLVVSGVSTAKLEAFVGSPLPVEAVMALDARLAGTIARPSLEATLDAPGLEVSMFGRVEKAKDARLEVHTLENHHLRLASSLALFDGRAALACEVPWTPGELLERLPTTMEAIKAPLDCALEVSGVDVSALEPAWELTGRLGAKARFRGPMTRPLGELELSLTGGTRGGLTGLDALARLVASAEASTLTGSVKAEGAPLLTVDARVAAPVAELGSGADHGVSSTITLFPVELSKVFIATEGHGQPGGVASGSLRIQGSLFAPEVRATAGVAALRFDEVALGAAHLELTSARGRESLVLTLSGAEGEGSNALKLSGWLELPLSLKAGSLDWQAAPMSLSLESDRLALAFLSGIHPVVRVVGGSLSVRGTASGTLGSPKLDGEASWKDGRLALYGFGDYRDIELLARADETSITVETLKARSGAGVGSLSLKALRQADASWNVEGSGSLARFPITSNDQLVGTATLDLTFKGSAGAGLVSLDPVDIPKAEFELPEVKGKNLQPLEQPSDVFVKGQGTDRPRLPTMVAASPSHEFRAKLNAPKNLWVRGTDLNLELGLSEGFAVTQTDTTVLTGVATVRQGTLSVIGRKFTVGRRPDDTGDEKASELSFHGPPLTPDVNVTAVHINEREKVKVTVAVIGRGTDVSVTTTSEPPMSESDIYTLLATGRRELRRGSNASMTPEDAVSVVGQLAASQLKTALAKKLPIDVLSFEASQNLQKLKFDVGKYLSDSLYLGVSAQSGANPAQGENPWAGRLEYQLSRRFSLEAYGGTAPAAGVDLVWSRDY